VSWPVRFIGGPWDGKQVRLDSRGLEHPPEVLFVPEGALLPSARGSAEDAHYVRQPISKGWWIYTLAGLRLGRSDQGEGVGL
jgi:hypothetical protein